MRTSVNAVADAASSADMPTAAAVTCTRQPAPIPSAASRPPRSPCRAEQLRMYSVSAPGVMLSSRSGRDEKCQIPDPLHDRALLLRGADDSVKIGP